MSSESVSTVGFEIDFEEIELEYPCRFIQNGNKDKVFSGFSKINVFIGKNNSGKSTFIRKLASDDYESVQLKDFSFLQFKDRHFELFNNYENAFLIVGNHGNFQRTHSNNFHNQLEQKNISSFGSDLFNQYKNIRAEVASNFKNVVVSRNDDYEYDPKLFKKQFDTLDQLLKKVEDGFFSKVNRCYIPVLRSLRPLSGEETSNKDLYFERSNKDYFNNFAKEFSFSPEVESELHIFTGKSIYFILKEMLLGNPSERARVKEYEKFLSDNFFARNEVTLIPNAKTEGDLEILIDGDDQFPIYNVGDGLGQMIIITFPIFMRDVPSMFFIEEPDIFMHPGMQRVLIEAMLKNDRHQYFLTTHSNHIMDIAVEKPGEISLFKFQKEVKGRFAVKPMTNSLRQINDDLGVRNSSVLLANASIWVEGVTDKLYLKSFMKKYLDGLKANNDSKYERYSCFREDFHYIFVEYQGSNLPHFNFGEDDKNPKTTNVDSLIGNALVIADGDVKSKGKRIEVLESSLGGDSVICLKCKEIENLIPLPILKVASKKKFNNSNLDKKGVVFDPSKLKAPSYMNNKKYGVGKFLDDCLSPKNDYFSDPPAKIKNEKTGALKNKTHFCESVVAIMESGSVDFTLNKQTREMCLQIFEHIDKCNQSEHL